MIASRTVRVALLLSAASSVAAVAQVAPAPADPVAAPKSLATVAGKGARRYAPADFTRFAPRTAYDMLAQIPGFTIKALDQQQQERGLGQASENVLINGDRITDKSSGAVAQSKRTAIGNVDYIEIVDASALGIAGLSGQVANIVLKGANKAGGQFEWRPDFRAHYARPNLFRGSISYTGKADWLDYTLSVEDQVGRGAIGGPVIFTAADGSLIERRDEVFHSESDTLVIQAKLGFAGPGSAKGHLTLGYSPYWGPVFDRERRLRVGGAASERLRRQHLAGWIYDVNADYEFAAGPGRLKLIGLRHFDHEPIVSTQLERFDGGQPDQGTRFTRNSHIGETIGRAEYRWKGAQNDWQLSFERAFNVLDQRGALETLGLDGRFAPVAFPEGSGRVEEVRYEGLGTLSRPLGPRLTLQLAGGAEVSTLARVDGDLPQRRFFRPKGSLTFGWRPDADWDVSLKLRRRVGQISFYDFLSQPNLKEERENTGNPDLVPPQSWEAELEVGRSLGRWGKTRLRGFFHRIEDIVDIVPVGEDGEGIGNLPEATRLGLESTSTIDFAPLGWRGAKLDMTAGIEHTRVRDPLTGRMRPISGTTDQWVQLTLRHDVPRTDFAWGGSASLSHNGPNYYLTEVNREWEGPWFVSAYVEHKDVFGLTLRAQVGNIFNARHFYDRDVFGGRRTVSPLAFHQKNDQLIGPIFSFIVRGAF